MSALFFSSNRWEFKICACGCRGDNLCNAGADRAEAGGVKVARASAVSMTLALRFHFDRFCGKKSPLHAEEPVNS